MNNFTPFNKIIIIMMILFISSQSHAMIVGCSALTHCINNTKNKIVILYDKHAYEYGEEKKSHVSDMDNLINILIQNKQNISFHVEIGQPHKDPTRLQNMMPSPGNIPIRLALNNNMLYQNITFIPFDIRNDCDHFIRDMILQKNEFVSALSNKYKFPQEFYNITAQHLLSNLDARNKTVNTQINSLPICQTIKDQYHATNTTNYNKCNEIISNFLNKYAIKNTQHLLELIKRLNEKDIENFFCSLASEQCFAVDIHLFNNILQTFQKTNLSIILAGAYHSNAIEKFLLSNVQNIQKDQSSSMTLPDLKVEDIFAIQFPRNVPDNFMNENMKNFININKK